MFSQFFSCNRFLISPFAGRMGELGVGRVNLHEHHSSVALVGLVDLWPVYLVVGRGQEAASVTFRAGVKRSWGRGT